MESLGAIEMHLLRLMKSRAPLVQEGTAAHIPFGGRGEILRSLLAGCKQGKVEVGVTR